MTASQRLLCVMSGLLVVVSSAPTEGDSHAQSPPGLLHAHPPISTAQNLLLHRYVDGAAHGDVSAAHGNVTTAHGDVSAAHYDVTTAHDAMATRNDVTAAHDVPAAHDDITATHAVTPPAHGHAYTAHTDKLTAHDASPAHTARSATSAPTPTDGQLRPSRQPSARTPAAVARTKRGSGVVIRGPFYPYPRGRGPLRFTSGAAHTHAHALLLPVVAAASVLYTYGLRWA